MFSVRKDGEITAAIKARLQDTNEDYNVFEMRYSAIQPDECPAVNIIIPKWIPELDSSRGVYKTVRKVVLVLIVSGQDAAAASAANARTRLDELTDAVFRSTLFRHETLNVSGVMAFRLSEVDLEPDDKTDKLYLKRYLTFDCVTADKFPVKSA